jgi:hypothetical protein
MQGLASGRCLDVTGASISPGARPQLYDCLRDPQQQWLLDGTQLRVYADKCLDVTGDGKLNGTPVQIWYCNGGEQQQWTWRIDGTIRSRASGRCLDAIGGGSTNGTKLQIWDCSGATWQSFFRFTDAALSPTRGKPGTKVVITGPHLRGTREVTFGDMRAHFVVHSNTKITATVPKGADSGPVTIETPQGPGRSRAAFNVK